MPQKKLKELKALYGTAEPPETAEILKAGALSIERRGSNLGRIMYGDTEILRGISYLVRDENWGTCPAKPGKIKKQKTNDRLRISFSATARNGESTLKYDASITATPGLLEFTVTATPDRDFTTNRTGFVVLHPINGVAGKPVRIAHGDGTTTRSSFPKLISPGQPFFNIRSVEHNPAPGLKTIVTMHGNKFEMEDQRNWGDASFKTYVCSLLDPWPYILKAGESFQQTITAQISATAKHDKSLRKPATTPLTWRKVRLPEIGVAVSPEDAVETLKHTKHLRALKPDFLTCYWDSETSSDSVQVYAALARATHLPVTMELVLPGKGSAEEEVAHAAQIFASAKLAPTSVVITQAQDLKSFQPIDQRPWGPTYDEMAQAGRRYFPHAQIGGGMISYFTELNRKPPPRGVFDFITHSICPIVHDASDISVMQALETLPHIFASAKHIIGGAPYHLGPTTIAARMNPYGAAVTPNPKNRRVCLAPKDPRQFGEFAVTWNMGLLVEAARAGVKKLTLGSLRGPRGLLDANGLPTPLYDVLKMIQTGGEASIASKPAGPIIALKLRQAKSTFAIIGSTAAQGTVFNFEGRIRKLGSYRTLCLRHASK